MINKKNQTFVQVQLIKQDCIILIKSSMIKVFLVILVSSLAYVARSVLGVDVSQLFSVSTYQCMKKNNYLFAIIRAYKSYGGLDSNAIAGLANAKKAGLITDIYMFPCRGKSATAQVDQLIKGIPKTSYGMIWVDVQTNPSTGCSWAGKTADSNCKFLTDTMNRIKYHGKTPAIYSNAYMWETIFKSKTACPAMGAYQIWYAHYDKKADFSDWKNFGGWTKPNIKQYQGDTTLCGASVDKNYYK